MKNEWGRDLFLAARISEALFASDSAKNGTPVDKSRHPRHSSSREKDDVDVT